MKTLIATLIVGVLALVSAGNLKAQSADIIVNNDVAATSLDKAALKDILIGKTTYWPGGQAITIVVLADKTDAALQDITGMSASQFKTHWQRLVFSGRGQQPKQFDDEAKLLAQVASSKGAIALVPAGTDIKGAKKIELK
jgi:ABC-type phosphate transport system substrate-binding protein